MATGDWKNSLKQLHQEVKAVKYTPVLDVELIKSGSAKAYLPVYHYLFTGYNSKLNADIVNANNELYGKSDMRFMEAVYKILRDMFDYKPKITRDQFFAPGYVEHKMIMLTDVIRAVKKNYRPPKIAKHMTKSNIHTSHSGTAASKHEKVDRESEEAPPKIVNHKSVVANVAGAIVLPSKGSGRSHKLPTTGSSGLKHFQERPIFAVPVISPQTVTNAASSSSARPKKSPHNMEGGGDAMAAWDDDDTPTVQSRGYSGSPRSQEDFADEDSAVRRKIVHIVSPALVKLNERVGMMEIALSDLEKREEPTVERSEPQPSAALLEGLTRQMGDMLFKVQTLTSRLTLVENRMTMMEAQFSEEENHRKTMMASQNYFKSKQVDAAARTGAIQQNHLPSCDVVADFTANSRPQLRESSKDTSNTLAVKSPPSDPSSRPSLKDHRSEGRRSSGEETQKQSNREKVNQKTISSDVGDGGGNEAMDGGDVGTGEPHLAFMKELIPPEDCGSLLTTTGDMDSSAMQAAIESREQPLHEAQTQNSAALGQGPVEPTPFISRQMLSALLLETPVVGDSPLEIRQRCLDFSSCSYDADQSTQQPMSSTLTDQAECLDISTTDRVSRINEMMAKTQRLLQKQQ